MKNAPTVGTLREKWSHRCSKIRVTYQNLIGSRRKKENRLTHKKWHLFRLFLVIIKSGKKINRFEF